MVPSGVRGTLTWPPLCQELASRVTFVQHRFGSGNNVIETKKPVGSLFVRIRNRGCGYKLYRKVSASQIELTAMPRYI